MALGGGIWNTQNKVLPGTYINFSGVSKASAELSERGFAAMPLLLDWGPENQVFTVTNKDFQKNSLKIFGYGYTEQAMLPLRELFRYTQTLYAYRLNSGGKKASNKFCEAKYGGTVGNKLSTVIAANVDEESKFDVSTYYDTMLVDMQTVAQTKDLLPNDFVTWKSEAVLEATAKTPLTEGTNGTAESAAYQTFLDKIESYRFNTLGCPTADRDTIGLFVNFTKRMRDEAGAKFQTVIFNGLENEKLADHEGIIEVGSKIIGHDDNSGGLGPFGLVYWMTGVSAGCAVNQSNTNKRYDGELTIQADHPQAELEKAITSGRLMFHNVNGEVRILEDKNSLVTVSEEKGDVFQSNQTIRVLDQIANDIAVLFNTKYLGSVPNDAAGRISLWNDIVKHHTKLQDMGAIENFHADDVTVLQGDTKKAIVVSNCVTPVNGMTQLYMTVCVQ